MDRRGTFESVLAPVKTSDEVRAAIKDGIVQKMNAGKVKPSSINVYPRLNSVVRWANLEEHFNPALKGVPLLKTPTKVISPLNESQVQHSVPRKLTWWNLFELCYLPERKAEPRFQLSVGQDSPSSTRSGGFCALGIP